MREGIRPATAADLPEVIALYARVYPDRGGASLQRREAYLRRILLEHPWRTDDLPSFVYLDKTQRAVGFLGVMPRPMSLRGRPVRMAVSHHFMVDPAARASLAGVSLMKTFLSGSQDLSVCDPRGDLVRKIWEAAGGTTALLQSLHWKWLIRPFGYLTFLLKERRRLSPVASALRPACLTLDAMVTRMRRSPFRLPERETSAYDLDEGKLLPTIEDFSREFSLRPVYDAGALSWLLAIIAGKKKWGELRRKAVHKAGKGTVGYYLYFAKKDGVSKVLQVAARKGAVREVLNDLVHDAWASGAVALSGRMDARYAYEISGKVSYFKYGENWLLVHSRDPDVQHALYTSDTFLTCLEDEWWIPFGDGGDQNRRAT